MFNGVCRSRNISLPKLQFVFLFLMCSIYSSEGLCRSSLFGEAKNQEANVQEWKEFRSVDGLFTIQYPSTWELFIQGTITHLIPPNKEGAISIIAYDDENLAPNFTESWLRDTFSSHKPVTKMESIQLNNWRGYRQEFALAEKGLNLRLVAVTANAKHTFVLMTATDLEAQMLALRSVYEKIFQSLKLIQGDATAEQKN